MATDQEFNRHSIAYFDFTKALEYATAAQKHPPNTVEHESLLFAAIVSYCRPFSPNEKDKTAPATSQLSIEEFPSLLTKQRELHELCKTLRNKALAHSEFSFNPTRLNPATGVIASKPFSLITVPFDLDGFIHLTGKFSSACDDMRAAHVIHGRF